MNDIFTHIVPEEKLSNLFICLDKSKILNPAKEIIKSIAEEIQDKDGNFVEQFQTTGFDARLWEMFLFKFFQENNFEFVNEKNRPDFHLRKEIIDFFVEASISNEKEGDKYGKNYIQKAIKENDLAIQKELVEYYVVRMGSVLFSKLQKKYWELDWVKNKPLIIAISPFHNYIAKFLPDAKIMEYLYGIKYETELTEKGLFIKDIKTVENHTHLAKDIPSNFFSQENVENISAIIFTNNADLHKFNRMGYQKGLSKENIIMSRSGISYNSEENSTGKEFTYDVKPGEYRENWSESVTIFHNPNAKNKLAPNLFSNIRQIWLKENGRLGGNEIPENFVYQSVTGAGILKN